MKVFEEVNADAVASAPGRREAVQAKDLRDNKKSRAAIRRLFPRMPVDSVEAILEHGFQKGSGRVGRTKILDEDKKVRLAVEAHIRHTFTPYDILLRGPKDSDLVGDLRRERARATVWPRIQEVLAQWSSDMSQSTTVPVAPRSSASTTAIATAAAAVTSPIVGDAVTQSYQIRQAVVSISEQATNMISLNNSIHAGEARWNENESLHFSSSTDSTNRTLVRGPKDGRGPRKISTTVNTTMFPMDDNLVELKVVSLEDSTYASVSNKNLFPQDSRASAQHSAISEISTTLSSEASTLVSEVTQESFRGAAGDPSKLVPVHEDILSTSINVPGTSNKKRVREVDEDVLSTKRPRHQVVIASPCEVEETRWHTDMSILSFSNSGSMQEDDSLYTDFDAMQLDDVVKSLRNPINNSPDVGSLANPAIRIDDHSDLQQNTRENQQYDMRIYERIVDLRNIIRLELLRFKVGLPQKKPKSLPGFSEQKRLRQLKAMLKGHFACSRKDFERWLNNFQLFGQFSKHTQRLVILFEFREHLVHGRMDHSLALVEHDEVHYKDTPEKSQPKLSLIAVKNATRKTEIALDKMIGTAQMDYCMMKADPYFENTMSTERSWAAWKVFEFHEGGGTRRQKRQNLRKVLRRRLLKISGQEGSSKETAFIIQDDEEEEGQVLDHGVLPDNSSPLSERPVRRTGENIPNNLPLTQPRHGRRLDGVENLRQPVKENLGGKENVLAI